MPATKKSAAYEKGLREGRADKSKPSIEIEINPEGEEEEEMGTEEMDGAKPHSRKRSAKGAKNTKAPMDAECGCMGKGRKGKASCDGSCGKSMKDGSYAKKMDRNDALSPQEYLAACDLGIQHRSRAYIRSRLDAAERLDLKCGAGSISEGEKCTKGTAQKSKARPPEENIASQATKEATKGALSGALGGAIGGLVSGYLAGKSPMQLAAFTAKRAAGGALLGGGLGATSGAGSAIGNRAGNAIARRMGGRPKGRRDSVYAAGFSPELDQLAI
jgi:hypothetical protein